MSQVKEISVEILNDWIQSNQNFRLLDIRTVSEIQQGMIPGGEVQSMRELPSELNKYEDQDEILVFYCRSGIRSYQVCEFMQEKGYSNVYNLEGGIISWAEKGFDICECESDMQQAYNQ